MRFYEIKTHMFNPYAMIPYSFSISSFCPTISFRYCCNSSAFLKERGFRMSPIGKHYELARHHELAGQSYDADLPDGVRNGINHEMERLEKFAPVEYAITKRYLLRYIPEGATIADVGVGVGHYSELLASRGSNVHLVDVALRLLDAAQERLIKAGLQDHILSVTNASATDLSFIPDESCDAVLMLGPF